MKKKILGVIVLILLLLIIGIIWYESPVNFMALDPSDVAEITIFDGSSGEAVNISGEDEIEYIISNLNAVKLKRGSLSQGKKGYRFRFTIRLEEYAETVGWTSFIVNSNDTIRRDPFFYNVTNGNVDLEYIQSLFDEASGDMNIQVASPEETFVLTDSGKEFLQRMCLYVPEFDSEVDMDMQFWRDFMFYSFTGMFDESVEQVEVYREGLGFEEPQAKVSLEQMEEYANLTFGVALPDLKPKYEELGEKETAFYFEDGFYYIGCSDFPNYSFTYKDCTVVDELGETSISVDYDITFEGEENYGTVTFTLSPEDNENGFIILSKTWELNSQRASNDTLNPEDEEKVYEVYNSTWTEEDILNALGERHPFYVSSAYYPEMINYWENVRGVRDISSLMVPLYETDEKYYTKEDFADEPELVIHLAKNEIYARHGYIFKDEDIYNYFMGCIWYGPTCAPEEFDDAVFNEFEKKNLKLLASLDTY